MITASAPADRIPLFQRGGYVIPMYAQAPLSTMGHYPELLELHVIVPDEEGVTQSMLQEDDGLSSAFLSGAYLRTTFEVSRRGNRVTVSWRVAGHGFSEFRRSRIRFTLKGDSCDAVELNGSLVRLENSQFECENRGQAGSFAFSI